MGSARSSTTHGSPGGPAMATDVFSLDAKWRLETGTIFLSGIQALVRVVLDQHRADRRRGLNTATLVSGYRGSPLGGLDLTLERNPELLREHQVHFISGVNEELGATAVFGSQLADLFPQPRYDGVLGLWYGKGPGVDRSGDILRHANYAGVGRHGGVLAVAGDDPAAKSSTLPTHSEPTFWDLLCPVVYPGSVQDILDLGRLGFELSRYSGLWVGFKIVTDVADAVGTAEVAPDRIVIRDPDFTYEGRPWQARQPSALLPAQTVPMEREIHRGRLAAARAFAAANGLNRLAGAGAGAWLGIVAAGKTFYDVRQALHDLGLDDAALARHGVRLLKLGLVFPLEPGIVGQFAHGLEEIVVVEEKRAFVELLLREILWDRAERPRLVGKRDEHGRELVPADGELDGDALARLLAARLARRLELPSARARLAELEAVRERPAPATLARLPFFCSGCPHNRSTLVPEGSRAAAGIGCHSMVLFTDRPVQWITPMGGEGVQWVGLAPFTEVPHLFQQLGDGTLFHSGSLAIRQAVAAGTNITYKILYNSTVAMTGGQDAAGAIGVPTLTRQLEAEGVRRVLVLTDEPKKYGRDAGWARGVEVWHRDRLDEAQRLLREIPGVTALVYDQRCAAEKRRLRKRGRLPDPALRVVVNEAVCEGCGDCGVKSNCLSVHPVETEFGRKTQIHQSSCNKDYSCLLGDCPSFVTVTPRGPRAPAATPRFALERELPEPVPRVRRDASLFLMGIGGTGIVTVNQVLGTAALLDGRWVLGLDQTGLSQKGGPVLSHLKLADAPREGANKVGANDADCYLGFDLLAAGAPPNLARARPDRTIAVVSTTQVPTGAMVASPDVHYPEAEGLLAEINRVTRKDENVFLDALALAEALFGDHMAANMIVLGAAYQAGALPIGSAAIERAIQLNGTAVEMNTQAFRAGRLAVADPAWLSTIKRPRAGAVETAAMLTAEARALVDAAGATGELRRLLEIRAPELIAYQDLAYARQYVDFVARVAGTERAARPGQTRLAEAVARHLFKLMAYKDEYEVARLHLAADVGRAFAADYPDGVTVRYQLHPPILRALGLKRKLAVGRWFDPVFRLLVGLRRLRGTALDPFGWASVRRVERALVGEYRALIEAALAGLSPDTYERAVRLAELPDLIRGYEGVKLASVERFRREVEKETRPS
ncbi:MAG: indolepyruvate ferredoxin oxidoreductase family protein [Candidatus Rokubacteria bacterium]|nr:indolepyruvate ferredoxin oxidoreductase family protein [Candidatus Rokubacteria bacterium]